MPAKKPAPHRPPVTPVAFAVAIVTAASLLTSSLPTPAHAAEPTHPAKGRPTDEARADAEKRLDEGLDRYAKGDYEGARLAFAQAYAVLASIDLLHNLMRAELKANHPLEALVHIHQLLRNPAATGEDRSKAERLLEEANRSTGHLAVEAPDGAEIAVDQIPSGEAPVMDAYDLSAGRHVVIVKANGTARTVEVDCPAGQLVTAHVTFEVGSAPSLSAPVPIPLNPPPRVRIPAAAPPAPPGADAAPSAPESNSRYVVPAVLGAVGVIALGVGIGMGFASQGQETNATNFRNDHPGGFCVDRTSPNCTQYQSILNSQQEDTTVSRVLLISGGVLVVAGVVAYLVWPHHRREHAAWIAPALGGVAGQF